MEDKKVYTIINGYHNFTIVIDDKVEDGWLLNEINQSFGTVSGWIGYNIKYSTSWMYAGEVHSVPGTTTTPNIFTFFKVNSDTLAYIAKELRLEIPTNITPPGITYE